MLVSGSLNISEITELFVAQLFLRQTRSANHVSLPENGSMEPKYYPEEVIGHPNHHLRI